LKGFVAGLHRLGEGLFTDDVDAVVGGGTEIGEVGAGGRGDRDEIEIGGPEGGFVIGRGFESEFGGEFAGGEAIRGE